MYRVDEVACVGCDDCVEACPAGAIALVDGLAHIDGTTCTECGSCAATCPQGAIVMTLCDIPASTAVGPTRSLSPLAPSTPAVRTLSPAYRSEVELLPAEPRISRLWPMVGSALVWAARELLPAVLRSWQETPGRAEGALTTRRHLGVSAGKAAGQRRYRRQYGKHGAARGQSGSGSSNQNRC